MTIELQDRFSIRELSVLAYANGFTLWHCKVGVLSDVTTYNYFSDAADMLGKGDVIICSASDGVKMLFVVSSDSIGDIVVIAST